MNACACEQRRRRKLRQAKRRMARALKEPFKTRITVSQRIAQAGI
jgi:hypothetical protein